MPTRRNTRSKRTRVTILEIGILVAIFALVAGTVAIVLAS